MNNYKSSNKKDHDIILSYYLKEIGNKTYNPISVEQEYALSRQIQKGNKKALYQLVEPNLRFAVSIAKNYQGKGMPLLDLINEGNLGLIRAAKRYDETKEVKFISYAVWWIRQGILQAIAKQSRDTKIPLNRVGLLYKINKADLILTQKYQRFPTNEEIANHLELTEQDVNFTRNIAKESFSLDDLFNSSKNGNDDETKTLFDVIPNLSDESITDKETKDYLLRETLDKKLNTLDDREKDIVKKYFGIDEIQSYTLEQISEMYKMSRERIRQIKRKALNKLRKNGNLKEFTSRYISSD